MEFGGTQVEGDEEGRSPVCDVEVGGLILFERDSRTGEARNITSPEQVRQLTSDLQALSRQCTGRRLLIAADNEGGLVMRLSPRLGYLPTPPPQALGDAGDAAATALESRRMGPALREAAINWHLAPVLRLPLN